MPPMASLLSGAMQPAQNRISHKTIGIASQAVLQTIGVWENQHTMGINNDPMAKSKLAQSKLAKGNNNLGKYILVTTCR